MTSKAYGQQIRIAVFVCASFLVGAGSLLAQCPAGSTCFGEVDTNSQSPSISFSGDIQGARWLQHLGGFQLTFSSDSSDGHSLGTGDTTFLGNTYRPKVAFTPTGDILTSGNVNAGSMLISSGQVPIVLVGDIDGAKWLQKLGDFELTFSSDSANTATLGTGDVILNGRTYRPKVAVDPAGNLLVSGGVAYPDGSVQTTAAPGLKHARGGGCSLGSSASCSVSLSWAGSGFSDTNYTAVCTPENAGNGTLAITGKSTTGVTVTFSAILVCVESPTGGACGNSVNASMGGVDCIAMHD